MANPAPQSSPPGAPPIVVNVRASRLGLLLAAVGLLILGAVGYSAHRLMEAKRLEIEREACLVRGEITARFAEGNREAGGLPVLLLKGDRIVPIEEAIRKQKETRVLLRQARERLRIQREKLEELRAESGSVDLDRRNVAAKAMAEEAERKAREQEAAKWKRRAEEVRREKIALLGEPNVRRAINNAVTGEQIVVSYQSDSHRMHANKTIDYVAAVYEERAKQIEAEAASDAQDAQGHRSQERALQDRAEAQRRKLNSQSTVVRSVEAESNKLERRVEDLAEVLDAEMKKWEVVRRTIADSDGKFEFAGLDPGSYTLVTFNRAGTWMFGELGNVWVWARRLPIPHPHGERIVFGRDNAFAKDFAEDPTEAGIEFFGLR